MENFFCESGLDDMECDQTELEYDASDFDLPNYSEEEAQQSICNVSESKRRHALNTDARTKNRNSMTTTYSEADVEVEQIENGKHSIATNLISFLTPVYDDFSYVFLQLSFEKCCYEKQNMQL